MNRQTQSRQVALDGQQLCFEIWLRKQGHRNDDIGGMARQFNEKGKLCHEVCPRAYGEFLQECWNSDVRPHDWMPKADRPRQVREEKHRLIRDLEEWLEERRAQ